MVTDEDDWAALRLVSVRNFGQARHADAVLAGGEKHWAQALKIQEEKTKREENRMVVSWRGQMVACCMETSTESKMLNCMRIKRSRVIQQRKKREDELDV